MTIRSKYTMSINGTLGLLLKTIRTGYSQTIGRNEYVIKKNASHENDNLTMRQLAEKFPSKVQHTLIGKLENGHRNINIGEFITYCESMDVAPGTVFNDLLMVLNGAGIE